MSEQKSNPEEKKSSKKLIIIIAAVVLLLGGGGAGYYFFMHKAEPAAEAESEEAKDGKADKKHKGKKTAEKDKEKAKEHEASAEEGDKAAAHDKEPVFFALTQPMIVNFPKGQSASLIQIGFSMLADSEETTIALKKHEPMLRNNIMMKINAQDATALKTKGGKEALRGQLLQEVNQILSKVAEGSTVKEVFFTTFVMQ